MWEKNWGVLHGAGLAAETENKEGEIVKEHRSQVHTEEIAPGEWMKHSSGMGGTERPDMTWDTEIRKLLAGTIQLWENGDGAEIGGSEGHGRGRTTMWL